VLTRVWAAVESFTEMTSYYDDKAALVGTTTDWDRDADAKWPLNFERSLAQELFVYCSVSYCSAEAIGQLACGTLCEEIAPNVGTAANILVIAAPHTETQTLISVDDINGLIIICTRGTTGWDLTYWIIDLAAFPQRVPDYCPTCYVHAAFYGAYGAVKRDVYRALFAVIKHSAAGGLSVVGAYEKVTAKRHLEEDAAARLPAVVGHSAGGATAYLTAMDMAKGLHFPSGAGKMADGTPMRYIFTYGAPRVGNAAFVAELEREGVGNKHGVSEGWRCIQGADPIPFSVPELLGYVHALPAAMLTNSDTYRVCKAPDVAAAWMKEDPTCGGTILTLFLDSQALIHHAGYFGRDMFTNIMGCGMLNEENAFYNGSFAETMGKYGGRAARSWLPF